MSGKEFRIKMYKNPLKKNLQKNDKNNFSQQQQQQQH